MNPHSTLQRLLSKTLPVILALAFVLAACGQPGHAAGCLPAPGAD